MFNTPGLLFASLTALVVVAIMHNLAEMHNLYYTLWWFDIPTHFMGGVTVGCAVLWLTHYTGLFPLEGDTLRVGKITIRQKTATFFVVFISIAIVALAWELMEVGIWVTIEKHLPVGYLHDMLLDLVMGTAGAISAWAVFHTVQLKAWRKA